jgi:hypothetical protein
MLKLKILNHWIVPQQGKNQSEIDEEPVFENQVQIPVPNLPPVVPSSQK